jgi:hypothetical protein
MSNWRRWSSGALEIPVTPHQSLMLDKHMRGLSAYPNGVSLSSDERSIALQLHRIHLRGTCRKLGTPYGPEHEQYVERGVRRRELGMSVGHKIGEATGCFQVLMIWTMASLLLIGLTAAFFQQ